MEAAKVEVKPVIVMRTKENILCIGGCVFYPGITVIPASKAVSVQENKHFIQQVSAGNMRILNVSAAETAEDNAVSQKSTAVTGEQDTDQVNAIQALIQKAALVAVKGELNITVLKKVAAQDSRPAVKLAAQQRVDELIKTEA